MTIAELLDSELRAATLPIVGVTVGDVNDRATWAPIWNIEPTAQQVTDAQAIIDNLDVSGGNLEATAADATIDNDPVIQALVEMIAAATTTTYADARLDFITKYLARL